MYMYILSNSIKAFYKQLIYKNAININDDIEDIGSNEFQQNHPLNTFILDDDDMKYYESILLNALYNSSTSLHLLTNRFYLNDRDKEKLYQAVILNTNRLLDALCYEDKYPKFFHNQEDLDAYIMNSLICNDNIRMLFTVYNHYLNEKIMKLAISLLKLEDEWFQIDVLIRISNEDYQMRLFKEIFTKDNYLLIYNTCLKKNINNLSIRNICFNYIIDNNDSFQTLLDQVPLLYDKINNNEIAIVYHKFHHEIFIYKAFKEYFKNCKLFGKFINQAEKAVLIQHIKTKTRIRYINEAINKITFNDKELSQLNAIKLVHEIK